MGLIGLIDRFFGRVPESSKNTAKDRLRLVLMHDRADIPASMMEAIRREMVVVLSKYVEIDQDALEVQLEKEAGSIGLVLNIPIKRVKSESEVAAEHEPKPPATLPAPPPAVTVPDDDEIGAPMDDDALAAPKAMRAGEPSAT